MVNVVLECPRWHVHKGHPFQTLTVPRVRVKKEHELLKLLFEIVQIEKIGVKNKKRCLRLN